MTVKLTIEELDFIKDYLTLKNNKKKDLVKAFKKKFNRQISYITLMKLYNKHRETEDVNIKVQSKCNNKHTKYYKNNNVKILQRKKQNYHTEKFNKIEGTDVLNIFNNHSI
jgi:hypothetical protein